MPKPIPDSLRAPVTTIDEAYAWIRTLVVAELSFHFEDSPDSIIFGPQNEPLFSDADAEVIKARIDEIYALPYWGRDLCPIGVLCMFEGFDGYNTYDIPEYQPRGEPSPSKAIVVYDEDGILIADRYCTPGQDPGRRFEVSTEGKVLGVYHLFEDALAYAKGAA